MKQTKKKGFTLVELIIVIAVIGVLAAILIPVFANVIKKANSKAALSDARNAVSQYVSESLERRLLANKPIPEQIVLIVEKAGRYYVFGYDTAVSQSIQVSSVNEEGILASGLNDLINTQSWNAHHTEAYDPYTTTTYSVQSDGAFYLVPYTGTTPDNPDVRGFVQSTGVSGNFFRLDKEDQGYGFDLNVGNDTIAFHGCLVNGTYENTSTSSNDSSGSGDTTPTSYSVNFTTTGIDSADLANVVYKKGSQVLSNPATLTEGTGVGTLTAECPVATSAYSYTFTGATASNGHSTIDEADMTITFAFTKVMAQTYNVTYNANGGSGTMTDNTDYLTNAVITLPENTFTAPEHKHFTGWLINNTGELRQAGYQFNITADTEIYAQWGDDAQIAVHFNSNGGTGTMEDVSVYAGSYTLPECTFTKTHYHFNGWKANNTGATLGATYNVTEEVTFYATWEQDATYTITYNGNGATGGTAPTDSNSYYMNDSATLAANTFTYTHKHFTGWKVANGGALLSAGSSYTVTGSVTMYAQWEDDATYTVTYKGNGATGGTTPTDSHSYYAGESATVLANTFTRTNYTFKYFTTTAADSGTHYAANDSITVNGNVTLYAQWEENAASGQSVTFNLEFVKYSDAEAHWHDNASDYCKTYTCDCVVGENKLSVKTIMDAGSWCPNTVSGTNTYTFIPTTGLSQSTLVGELTVNISAGQHTCDLTVYTRRIRSPFSVTYYNTGNIPSGTVSNTYNAFDTVTAIDCPFTKQYMTFTGWNTNQDGTGTTINAGDQFEIIQSTSLYAQWESAGAQLTIHFVDVTGAAITSYADGESYGSGKEWLLNPTKLSNLYNSSSVYQAGSATFDASVYYEKYTTVNNPYGTSVSSKYIFESNGDVLIMNPVASSYVNGTYTDLDVIGILMEHSTNNTSWPELNPGTNYMAAYNEGGYISGSYFKISTFKYAGLASNLPLELYIPVVRVSN